MRIELTDDEAARVQGVLQAVHGGQEINRLAGLFSPPSRSRAILRPIADTMTDARCEVCSDGIHRPDTDVAWVHKHAEPRDHTAVPQDEGEELVCEDCGSSEFTADEEIIDSRSMSRVDLDEQVVIFDGDQNTGDGGSGTEVTCESGHVIDLPDGWEIEYQP